MTDPDTEDLPWHVWIIAAAEQVGASGDHEAVEGTEQAARDIVGMHGAVFDGVIVDAGHGGVPRYEWRLRLPPAARRATDDDGVPQAVAALRAHLRSQLPWLGAWAAQHDLESSLHETVAEDLRLAYGDLLVPLEVALLGLRAGGAERLDPVLAVLAHGPREYCMTGRYAMRLAPDLDSPNPPSWIWLSAGAVLDPTTLPPGLREQVRGTHVAPDAPLLVWPRPDTVRFAVAVVSGPDSMEPRMDLPSVVQRAEVRWESDDPVALVHRVARAVRGLYPQLDG